MGVIPGRIVVIDNDQDFCLFMTAVLTDEGHRVETLSDLTALRSRLAVERPDVLITDVSIWPVPATELPAVLAADPTLHDLPVLFCSAMPAAMLAALAEPPLRLVLAKPFEVEELLTCVSDLLAQRPTPDGSHWSAD